MADTFCPTHGDISDSAIALGGVCGMINAYGTECDAPLAPTRADWLTIVISGRCRCLTGTAGDHGPHCCHANGPLCDEHDAPLIDDLTGDPIAVIDRLNTAHAALVQVAAENLGGRRG